MTAPISVHSKMAHLYFVGTYAQKHWRTKESSQPQNDHWDYRINTGDSVSFSLQEATWEVSVSAKIQGAASELCGLWAMWAFSFAQSRTIPVNPQQV